MVYARILIYTIYINIAKKIQKHDNPVRHIFFFHTKLRGRQASLDTRDYLDTVLPAKSDSGVMFLQSFHGLITFMSMINFMLS